MRIRKAFGRSISQMVVPGDSDEVDPEVQDFLEDQTHQSKCQVAEAPES